MNTKCIQRERQGEKSLCGDKTGKEKKKKKKKNELCLHFS